MSEIKTKREMAFLDHLDELRKRLVYCMIAVFFGFLLVYTYSEEVFAWLKWPLCQAFQGQECQLIRIGVAEEFLTLLKLSFIGGIFLSAPVIFYQIWMFVSPGLKNNEKKYVLPFVTAASFMFMGGGIFGYFFVFPYAFEFFLNYTQLDVEPMFSMEAYYGFTSTLLFAFGILFELPVVVILLNLLGIVSAKSLWATWRYAICLIFILSAVLTPADPYTMVLLAVPLTFLYIGSLGVCSLLELSRKAKVEV